MLRPMEKSAKIPKDPSSPKPKKRLHCSVQECGYSTFIWRDLSRHMRKHTGEKPFPCERCDQKFSRYDKLLIHTRVHEGNRPFKCSVCEYSTVDSTSLKKHVRTHTGIKPYKCDQCNYSSRDSSQLVVHTRKHTGDFPYLCMVESCRAAFKTHSDLKRHLRFHTGEKPYKCLVPNCNYKAAVKCNLTVHARKHHLQVNDTDRKEVRHGGESEIVIVPVPCDQEASSSTVIQMQIAKKTKVNVQETFYEFACKFCTYRGTKLKTFESHMKRRHKNAKLQHASSTSNNKSNLLKTAPKSFSCPTCSVSFFQDKSLKCHMRQHISPIPICVQPAPKPIVISVIKNNTNSIKNPSSSINNSNNQTNSVITFGNSNYSRKNTHV